MSLECELPAKFGWWSKKLGAMIHFISPQHVQVRHILNLMASGPILPKVGKVNILWLFLLQFEILPATFAGRWEDNADFKVFLGKCKNLFPENILTKGNLTMTQKWGFAHWILLFLSKMEFSLIVEQSFVFNNPPNFHYWKDDWLSANQPSIYKVSLVAFIDINIKISITISHLIQGVSKKRYFFDFRLIYVLETGFNFFACNFELKILSPSIEVLELYPSRI